MATHPLNIPEDLGLKIERVKEKVSFHEQTFELVSKSKNLFELRDNLFDSQGTFFEAVSLNVKIRLDKNGRKIIKNASLNFTNFLSSKDNKMILVAYKINPECDFSYIRTGENHYQTPEEGVLGEFLDICYISDDQSFYTNEINCWKDETKKGVRINIIHENPQPSPISPNLYSGSVSLAVFYSLEEYKEKAMGVSHFDFKEFSRLSDYVLKKLKKEEEKYISHFRKKLKKLLLDLEAAKNDPLFLKFSPEKGFLSQGQVNEFLGYSSASNLIKQKKLKATREGGFWFINKEDVEKYIKTTESEE